MQYNHHGKKLWFGTDDTPAPDGVVQTDTAVTITIGVSPPDASNKIKILYRKNHGPVQTISAPWLRNDRSRNAQYFQGRIPATELRAGDKVEYTAVCNCVGRQVPPETSAMRFPGSFQVSASSGEKSKTEEEGGRGRSDKAEEESKSVALPHATAAKKNNHKEKPEYQKLKSPQEASGSSKQPKNSEDDRANENGRNDDSVGAKIETINRRKDLKVVNSEEDGKPNSSVAGRHKAANDHGQHGIASSPRIEESCDDTSSEPEEEFDEPAVSGYNLEPPEKQFQIKGKLIDRNGNRFTGHQVVASFQQQVTVEGDEAPHVVWMPSEERAEVAKSGDFVLLLPDKNNLQGSLNLNVIAPDGEVLLRREFSLPEIENEINIEVEAKTPREMKSAALPAVVKRLKLSGRVLDAAGKQQVVNKQVLLYGRLAGAEPEDFTLLLASRTDKQGYFSGKFSGGQYEEAYGAVSIGANEKVPIRLENGALPEKVVLVIAVPESESEGNCGCKAVVPRCPDSEDLVNASGTYSTDLGGGRCVEFTAPNRTLEEFSFHSVVRSTDPVIKGLTLNQRRKIPPQLLKALSRKNKGDDLQAVKRLARQMYLDEINALIDMHNKKASGRDRLSAKNPIDWDNEPTFYQATTIAHGHLLHFKQIWKADGYSLGDLLYSLPLAPCQKKQIAIIDWKRRERAEREERIKAGEEMDASITHNRDIADIINSALDESMQGESKSSTWSAGGGFSFGGFGVSGGGGGSNSSAWQNSSRDLAASELQQLRDRVMQAASAQRSQKATVVQTAKQGEDMEVTTEVVANHNHCHTMTIEYFEVLRHFAVEQELADVQECLFIPLLMSRFDQEKVLRWREFLGRFLRRRALRPGFDAIERIQNNYVGSDLPKGRYAEEIIEYLSGELSVSFEIFRPRDGEEGKFVPANWEPVMPFLDEKTKQLYKQFFNRSDAEEWKAFLDAVEEGGGGLGGFFIASIYKYKYEEKIERDKIFEKELAPRIAQGILESIKFVMVHKNGETEVSLDPTLVSEYVTEKPLYVRLQPGAAPPKVAREDIDFIEMRLTEKLPLFARVIVHSGALHYRTRHMSHFLFKSSRLENLLANDSPVIINTPLDAEELRNPRQEDREAAKKLITHLNEHLEYYHKVIWRHMDRDRRYMLLDGFEVELPNGRRRSLASVIENRLIGIAGNSLVMPVARGFRLDPNFNQDAENPVDLLQLYAPNTPIPPMRISVPTSGVYAEAVMGQCNSCEVKDDSRFWKWDEAPCGDEPTAIQAPSTESRRAEPPSLTPTPLLQPIIGMQTAPEAPAPTGLASAMQLLGTPNLFKDITGLDLNQQNAMSALSASLESAKAFGNMAFQLEQQKLANQAQLAQQNASSSNLNNQLQQIQQAKKDGHLTAEQAKELTRQALSRDIGMTPTTAGGNIETSPGSLESKKTDDGTLRDDPNSDDATAHTGQEPKCEDIELSSPHDYEVPGVKLFTQPNPNACWAAAATTLVYSRHKELDSIEKVLEKAEQQSSDKLKYLNKLKNGERLSGSEKNDFLNALELVAAPVSLAAKNTEEGTSPITDLDGSQEQYPRIVFYNPSEFFSLLKCYGPLWITTDAEEGEDFSAHARIVTGISGDFRDESYKNIKLKIFDPNPKSPNNQRPDQTYFDFMQEYGKVLDEDMKEGRKLRPQIVHLAASGSKTMSSDERSDLTTTIVASPEATSEDSSGEGGVTPKPETSCSLSPKAVTTPDSAMSSYLNKLFKNITETPWSLKPEEVVDRLYMLVCDPTLIQQGCLNLCGPVVFFRIWLERDPVRAVKFVYDLYRNGKGSIGTPRKYYVVEPSELLLRSDYYTIRSKAVKDPKDFTPAADWMMMSALRDSANDRPFSIWKSSKGREITRILLKLGLEKLGLDDRFLDNRFKGTPQDELSGITVPEEIKQWLEATGLYTSVELFTPSTDDIENAIIDEMKKITLDDISDLVRGPLHRTFAGMFTGYGERILQKHRIHPLKLVPQKNNDIIMFVNTHLYYEAKPTTRTHKILSDEAILNVFPNHWWVLESAIVPHNNNTEFKFTISTWGATEELTVAKEIFLANYYGAIIATI